MKNCNRTFTVIELGKPAQSTDIRIGTTELVEVIDLTTRVISQVCAKDVSIYRHTLRLHGKSFNIMNIRDFV